MVWPAAGWIAVMPAGLGDVHFAADDRLDARLLCRLIKSDRTKQVAVIGDRHRRHFVFGRSLRERVVVAGAIKKTESGMQVKMYKGRHIPLTRRRGISHKRHIRDPFVA